MSTIVTRAGKGSALTHNEVDANFNNLNNDKIEAAQSVTLTNKTIALGSNTVSGTTAQFNTALTDGDFATLAGSETLTNKTISGSSNTLSNIGNSSLTNSSVTIGSTSVSLGSTATTVSGLTLSSPTVNTPTLSGGTINNASVGATTPSSGAFTTLSATGVTTVQAGTAAAPAITTSGDANTGIFYPAADTVAIGTGGTERLRVDSAGNAGLGVTPSAWASGRPAIEASGFSLQSYSANYLALGQNEYVNSSLQYIYKTSAAASLYTQISGAHAWYTAPSGTAGNAITFTQAMTLDASGNLLVGQTSTPGGWGVSPRVSIKQSSTSGGAGFVAFSSSNDNAIAIGYDSGSSLGLIQVSYGTTGSFTPLAFGVGGSERARITSGGDLLVAQSSTSTPGTGNTTNGASIRNTGDAFFSSSGTAPLNVNRNTNDGTLVGFYQGGTEEGFISVSGTTVSYNGGHLSRVAQTQITKDETLVKGTVLSNLNEMNVYVDADGNPVPNEQLNKVKVSDVEGDVNVAGVFVNWSYDERHQVDEINMAMTGDMIIRIAQGVTVQKGDLLMSAGDGTAKPQGDDIVRSKTVAKVTSNHVTCTYDDGSYCVPCVLMAC